MCGEHVGPRYSAWPKCYQNAKTAKLERQRRCGSAANLLRKKRATVSTKSLFYKDIYMSFERSGGSNWNKGASILPNCLVRAQLEAIPRIRGATSYLS
jgi:hypothetical protein